MNQKDNRKQQGQAVLDSSAVLDGQAPYLEAVEMIAKICRSNKHKDPISDILCECNRAKRMAAEKAEAQTMAGRLKKLDTQAHELCWAIEELPPSERQTLVVTKAGEAAHMLNQWWLEELNRPSNS